MIHILLLCRNYTKASLHNGIVCTKLSFGLLSQSSNREINHLLYWEDILFIQVVYHIPI